MMAIASLRLDVPSMPFPGRFLAAVLAVVLVVDVASSDVRAQPAPSPSSTASVSGAQVDSVTLSLAGAVQRSLEVSPEVGQRRAARNFAEARLGEARQSRYLTSFTASTAHSLAPSLDVPSSVTQNPRAYYLNPEVENDWTLDALQPFTRFEVRAEQPLYTWGELSGSIRAARHGVDVEAAEIDQKTLEVARRTGELYYSLQLVQALKRLADETGDVVDRAKREVQRLLDEGAEDVDQADLFQVRLTEEEYKRRLVEINQRLETARSAVRRQLFLPDGTVVETEDSELTPVDFSLHPDSLDYYVEVGLRNRPVLDQAEAGVKARKALLDVEKSDYYPKLGMQVTYAYQYTPNRPQQESAYVGDPFNGNSTRTGIGIQFDLDFLQTRKRVDQARAELNEVRYQREAAQQLVRFEIEDAYRNVLITQEAVASRDRALTVTEEWLRNEQINFDLDLGDTENLVEAVRANLEAEARYYEAVKDYNVAVLDLLEATGILADRLQRGTLVEASSP